jgi:predicted dehydrogenase
MCLNHGKHVLCEKVLTVNADEAADVIRLAREKELFLMEAMWTRFFPIHISIRELIKKNEIGTINGIIANFVAKTPHDPENRFFNVELGAGVLLDLGSYGISWAFSLLGAPEKTVGLANFGPTGSDDQSAILMKYASGPMVTIMCSQLSYDVKEAVIFGAEGKIEVEAPWYKPTRMTIYREGESPQVIENPLNEYNGYEYEALEVMDCIASGKTESDVMPLDETLEIIRVLDNVRAQWGFKYPFESQ